MIFNAIRWAAALLLCTASVALAAERAAEVLRLSGIDAQLVRLETEMSNPDAVSFNLSPPDRVRMADIMKTSFAAAKTRPAMEQELRRTLPADAEAAALAWLKSDLGLKVRAMEARVQAEGQTLRHPALAKSILSTAPPERRELYRRLGTAIHFAEANADIMFNIYAAVLHAGNIATGRQNEHHFIRARAAVASRRDEMVQALRTSAMAVLAYTYRDLSEEELMRYVAFAESPAGLRYNDACVRAMANVFTAAASEMGTRIGQEFSRPR